MAYRKNESDRQADQVEQANNDGNITVSTGSGKNIKVGNPTGAGDNRAVSRQGIVVSHNDKLNEINAKAGKRRASNSN